MMGGVYMSYHTAEIPFVFHNIDRAEKSIGTSAEAKELEAQMSRAWINFARTGNLTSGTARLSTTMTPDL